MGDNVIFNELISKQLKNIQPCKRLECDDLKRICKHVNTSLFDPKCCCLWTGYITNDNNTNKSSYINFYFHKKKLALHRLLYANFVDNLHPDDFLRFNCKNKGKCCNVNHFIKCKYQSEKNVSVPKNICSSSGCIQIICKDMQDKCCHNDKLLISFD